MHGGSWYFRLQSSDGEEFEASDVEPDLSRERLELLAVVRGLEALEQPSEVTLVTGSRQISRAVRQGLDYWRQRDWKWERFGEKVPMKNADLWRRIDRALQIHEVSCRTFRIDTPHPATSSPQSEEASANESERGPVALPFRPVVAATRWMARTMRMSGDALMEMLPESAPNPHLTT